MSLLFDRKPGSERKQPHPTRPLDNSNEALIETPTVLLPRLTGPLVSKSTTTRPLVYIPASRKRRQTEKLSPAPPRRRRVMLGAWAISFIVILIAAFVVVPLSNGQKTFGLAQTINNLFNKQNTGIINPVEQIGPPTPTPDLMSGEGYCGGTDIWGTCATWITASGVMGSGQLQRPVTGAVITQPFAHPEYQFWCGCWKPHTGIDLAAPFGSPIMAADSGQVIWAGWDWSGLGWAVKINHGHYIATIYGHMERFIVHVGENVTKGQVIGYEGSTGASTGPHVHFMVMINNTWVNPQLYVQLP